MQRIHSEHCWGSHSLTPTYLLQPDTPLTGNFEHDEHIADVDSVRDAIEDARQEALIRQQGREAAEADGD